MRLRFGNLGKLSRLGLVLTTLALLAVASLAHARHHADEAHCGTDPLKQELVHCAALHGGVLAEAEAEAPRPEVRRTPFTTAAAAFGHAAPPREACAPRGPPIA